MSVIPKSDLFVFEMANNHQGCVDHGLKIISEVAEVAQKHEVSGAVKFQYRDLESLIHPAYRQRADVKHIPRFLATKLSKTEYLRLVRAVRQAGLLTMCTPFDEASVGTVVEHDVDIIKVASCSAMDWPLLRAIARTGKPVICSTGGLTLSDIDKVVSFFLHRKVELSLLHCVSLYPAPPSSLQLSFIGRLRARFPLVRVGYSGHECPDDTETVQLAIAQGATILERHVGVPADGVKLNPYSLNPEQTDAWVASALRAKEALAMAEDKVVGEAERESLRSLQRGVFATRAIKAGEYLNRSDVYFAMPCSGGQATAGEFQENIVASRDYAENDAIVDRRKVGVTAEIRSVLHEVKGMFNEARVPLGSNFDIEVSHHYGMEDVRKAGAVIIGIVNREYCKKLIALLPKQAHPCHKHLQKEETFQVLWGELNVQLDGRAFSLHAGDLLLVPRGTWHSFTTPNGTIFEEISTSHIRGDSYYHDETIEGIDPMERKTVIEAW